MAWPRGAGGGCGTRAGVGVRHWRDDGEAAQRRRHRRGRRGGPTLAAAVAVAAEVRWSLLGFGGNLKWAYCLSDFRVYGGLPARIEVLAFSKKNKKKEKQVLRKFFVQPPFNPIGDRSFTDFPFSLSSITEEFLLGSSANKPKKHQKIY